LDKSIILSQTRHTTSSIYTSFYTFPSVTEKCELLGSHNAEKLTTFGSVFLEGLRMTD